MTTTIRPRIDGNQYIYFALVKDTGTTQIWEVMNKSQSVRLAVISWYGGWRQYVLQPVGGTEYNNSCLSVIKEFLDRLNTEKRILPFQKLL